MKATILNLKAANGRHIRKTVKVTREDGKSIVFVDRIGKKEAIRS